MKFLRRKRTVCFALTAAGLVASLMILTTLSGSRQGSSDHLLYLPPSKSQLRSLNSLTQENSSSPAIRCTPDHNVAFIKTHKAGSSTIANILQRYGLSHNLTFALPNTRFHQYGYNYISKPGDILTRNKILPLPHGQDYNILFSHAVYNRTAFRAIMPTNTRYITILREPFQQFVSAFEYYHVQKIFGIRNAEMLTATNPISFYLSNPIRFERGVSYFSYIKNKQAEDLGLGKTEYFSREKTEAYIQQLDQDLSLVMIMEQFDESLLLLKRQLCWETKDILYIPRNKNKHKPDRNFTRVDYQRHRNISHLDYALYDHYLNVFKQKLKSLGPDFHEELKHFREILLLVDRSCLKNASLLVAASKWHDSFSVDRSDCELLTISELSGLDKLFVRMAGPFVARGR